MRGLDWLRSLWPLRPAEPQALPVTLRGRWGSLLAACRGQN